jgi:hypothetical protein
MHISTHYRREDYVTARQRSQDGTQRIGTPPIRNRWQAVPALVSIAVAVGLMVWGCDLMGSAATALGELAGMLVAFAGLAIISAMFLALPPARP